MAFKHRKPKPIADAQQEAENRMRAEGLDGELHVPTVPSNEYDDEEDDGSAADPADEDAAEARLLRLEELVAAQAQVIAKLRDQGLGVDEVAARVDDWAYQTRRRRQVYEMARKLRGPNATLQIFVQLDPASEVNEPIPVTNGIKSMRVPRGVTVDVPVELVAILDQAVYQEAQREVLPDGSPIDGQGPAAYLGPGGRRPGPGAVVRRVRNRHSYPFLITDPEFVGKIETEIPQADHLSLDA